MHGLSTNMLLLLHSAFMLNVAKSLLKEEVGGLNGINFCINKAIHMLLDHDFLTVHICILRPSQKLTSSTVMCIEVNVI